MDSSGDPDVEIAVGSPREDIKYLLPFLKLLDSQGCRQPVSQKSYSADPVFLAPGGDSGRPVAFPGSVSHKCSLILAFQVSLLVPSQTPQPSSNLNFSLPQPWPASTLEVCKGGKASGWLAGFFLHTLSSLIFWDEVQGGEQIGGIDPILSSL